MTRIYEILTTRFEEYKHIIINHNNQRQNVGEKTDFYHGGQLFDQFFLGMAKMC